MSVVSALLVLWNVIYRRLGPIRCRPLVILTFDLFTNHVSIPSSNSEGSTLLPVLQLERRKCHAANQLIRVALPVGSSRVLLHRALSLAVQCIIIGPVWVCGCVCVCVCVSGSVTTITRNCVHRSSPNWVYM